MHTLIIHSESSTRVPSSVIFVNENKKDSNYRERTLDLKRFRRTRSE